MRCSLFAALLTLGGLLGATSTSWAQTVQGRVLDGTNQPVIGAYLTNGVVTVATDMDGAYTLELKPGQHTIMCTFIGMSKQEFQVELTTGQTAQWNPIMTSAAEALGLVVVSAGRFEQDASEVTVSLEVLKPALVENKATTTLETAIEQTPGVSLVDGEPQIRSGSGFSYGAGSRVMVLVDDLPVLSGDAGRPSWGFLPLEN
ncbi:MAG: carboxypeptidase-like regulatory domain-containing protein, partial [Bacteroidota bacterium]|nr:carboxypeptidase-like regulatory domain-containing protein [Bacteroidota bacterium]